MKPPPPPIRFLVAVVGCWVGMRVLLLWPDRPAENFTLEAAPPPAAPTAAAAATSTPQKMAVAAAAAGEERAASFFRRGAAQAVEPAVSGSPPRAIALGVLAPSAPQAAMQASSAAVTAQPPLAYPPMLPIAPPSEPPPRTLAAPQRPSRWSGSAWLFVREAGQRGLAPGGTLGGSQAGGRIAYRLNADARRPISLAGRLYMPLDRPEGAEAALGIDWQPTASLPIHLLVERRERIGREGRSDFAASVYGGGERRLLRGRVRIEAYGQAGVVGLERADLFADGSVRAGAQVGPVELGAGAWGGAQPGAARLDVGPQASFRLPVGRTGIRASAEWRFRVAGDAQPGSGPAFTLATDF